ncbi:hypothetical protein [Tamaricihabitans halophyticus]|uniref:hypothetical protein n=1 Tax=Tamaricihabitans halophyticus TaxID=1262583 RepID=UPI0010441ACE|nr:hypothetical protein [Tamaricihabitans halophyticus]
MRSGVRKSVLAAAIAAVSLGAFGGTAVAEPAAKASWHSTYASWEDPNDKGGVSIYEHARKNGTDEYIMGQFLAYGEKLSIWDYHDNDRSAIVKVWVGGGDPAVYYGNGDGTRRNIDLSHDEGQRVMLQACTSDSPNAKCTPKKAKGVS